MRSRSLFPLKRFASRDLAQVAVLAAALFAFAHGTSATAAPDTYRVDPELSSTEFAVSHLGLSSQRGRFGRMEGTIVIDPEGHTGAIDFVVDATTVDTGWGARDAWLRGEDMFDVAHYPVMRFHSTQLVFNQERLIGIAGLLTLRGVTRPVILKIERMQCGSDPDGGFEGCGAGAVSTIKRSEFGLTYALGLVGDDIDLSFQVTAFRAGRQ
jgi:polyisoprenoid-binding protein YceI